MKKETYYCDICKEEMDKPGRQIDVKALQYKGNSVDFFISAGTNERCDICKYCLIGMAMSLDDRPTCKN